MSGAVPASWEPITGRPERGWIAPCPWGGHHLEGRGWRWWTCPMCALKDL